MSRARRHVLSVSLFPFLAVLICIMGALIIILVLMVARVGNGAHAASGADGQAEDTALAADQTKLRERLDEAQWRRELLERSRLEKSEELANKRAELSHLEDHIQRLQEQAKGLLERARTIDEGKQLRAEDLERARQEIARIKAEATEKKKQLDEKNKKQDTKEKWYALIPYDGPNGTRRRPIYIECDELGITIQPEGLVFRAEDFQGPLGPGNPLDAALRTIRERLAQGGGKSGEPYPLLVVRPGGILAYGAARAALKSWDDEFGYELIGDDKRLDYGEPDPVAAAAIEKTVRVARQRQAMLAAAMPRKFGGDSLMSFSDGAGSSAGGSGPGYGAGSGGGYGGGGSGTGGSGRGSYVGGGGNGLGGGNGTGNGFGTGVGGAGGGVTGGASGGMPGNGSGGYGGGSGGGGGGYGSSTSAVGASNFPGTGGGGGQGDGSQDRRVPGGGGTGSGYGNGSGGSGNGAAGSGGRYAGAANGVAPPGSAGNSGGNSTGGSSSNGAPSAGGASSGGGAGGAAGGGANGGGTAGGSGFGYGGSGPGSMGQSGTPVSLPNLGFNGGQSGSSGSGGSSGQSDGNQTGSSGSSQRGGKPSDAAKARKSNLPNWAVPQARVTSTGVTRPIHVAVLPDRLVILPDKGEDRRPQELPISPQLAQQEVDAFVLAVQKEMKGWGLAVQNGYWKPRILMDVAPQAEQQCRDLQMALEGSGFEMQRKLR